MLISGAPENSYRSAVSKQRNFKINETISFKDAEVLELSHNHQNMSRVSRSRMTKIKV